MKHIIWVLVFGFGASGFSTVANAQQAAAPFTAATRYNDAGQVTGTIAPDPDGGGPLGFPATRNTYATSGAQAGLLTQTEVGQLDSWMNDTVLPSAWSGFNVFQTRTFQYDSFGRKVAERVIGQNGTTIESLVQYSYDDWDRLKCKAVRMNRANFAEPISDACEADSPGTDGFDRITRYTYDGFDQVLTEERAVDTPLAQTYVTNTYTNRWLTSQTDARGNRTEFRPDSNYRLERRVYPSPTLTGSVNESDYNRYEYDDNGNVTLERKRNGETITNEYDANNRLVFRNLSDNAHSGDVAYDYDLRGLTLASCFGANQLDDACSASGAGETNAFDSFGNLTSRTSRVAGTSRTLTYQYDFEGNRLRVTHPDNWFFQYGFDGLNRMNSLGDSMSASPGAGVNPLLTLTYAPTGGRASITRTGGAVTSITPDNALRLDAFTQNFTGTSNDLTNGFDYNAASQVTTLTQSNTQYNYTAAQNRTGLYARNGLNQYTQIDGETLDYDANGNLEQDRDASGTLIDYTYDLENRLVQVEGATQAALEYDPLGRLSRLTISGNVTQFLYDGDALVAEYLNGALTRRYVHGDQVDEPLVLYTNGVVSTATRRFLHSDHQGSVIAWSDSATGAAVQKNAYDPYGIPAPGNSGRFGYTGQTWIPELGLNYYKARFYSPRLGRFLQTDPIFYKDDMNMYAYVGADPINAADPTGTTCFAMESGIGSVCAGPAAADAMNSDSHVAASEPSTQINRSDDAPPSEVAESGSGQDSHPTQSIEVYAYVTDVQPRPERLQQLFHPEKVLVDFFSITTAIGGVSAGAALAAPRIIAATTPSNVRALVVMAARVAKAITGESGRPPVPPRPPILTPPSSTQPWAPPSGSRWLPK